MESPPDVAPTPASPRPGREPAVCANCGDPLGGAYCPTCGQKVTPLQQPIHHFLGEAAVEYFGIDGRLWTSLKLLLLKPGELTREYLAGRRVRYLRPLRIYLSATLAFFFLLALLDPVGQVQGLIAQEIEDETGTMPAGDRVAELDSALAAESVEVAEQVRAVDSLRAISDSLRVVLGSTVGLEAAGEIGMELEDVLDDLDDETGDLDDLRTSESHRRHLRRLRWQRTQLAAFPPDSMIRVEDWDQAAQLVFPQNDVNIGLPEWMPRSQSVQRLAASRTSEERAEAIADFGRSAIGQLPTVMFLLLPVFAFLLKLIYVRRGWFYSEHLVFALHTHAFAFLVFAVIAALLGFSGGAAWAGAVAQLLMVGIPLYFFVAQKRVYGQGWLKTSVKALLLGWVYGFLLIMGMALAILLASAL